MNPAELIVVPAAPVESCLVCLGPIEFRLREDWRPRPNGPTPLDGFFAYERLAHTQCAGLEADILEAQRRESEALRAEETRQETLAEWMVQNGLADVLPKRSFETFETTQDNREALQLVSAWNIRDDFGLLIIGPSGTGKSHLALSLIGRTADELTRLDPRMRQLPIYSTASNLLAESKKGSFTVPAKFLLPRLVVIDDLGAENITDWSREILFSLFDQRWAHRMPTVVTTNLTLNELRDRLHERTISRILGLCVPIVLKGTDRRRAEIADRLGKLRARAGESQ